MRIVMCDDDVSVMEKLIKYLREYFSSNHLPQPEYAAYTSGEALLEKEEAFDIAFLDVEMPGISGIHVGAKLQKRNRYAKIFILTSYLDYLDEAMKFHVFRYLSKPLDKNRLFRNMKEALYQISIDTRPVLIETKKETFTRTAEDIVMVESLSRQVLVHAIDQDYTSIQPMKHWYLLTKIGCFYQTHRSYVINMKYVTAFTNNSITLTIPSKGKISAYLTRRRYQEFKKAYMFYLEEGF